MLSNYGAGEDSWEFLEQQRDQTSQSYRKSTLNIHWNNWCWSSQYFADLRQRADSFKKNLILGKTEGKMRRGWQRKRWLDGIINSIDMKWANSGWHGSLASWSPRDRKELRHDLATEQQQISNTRGYRQQEGGIGWRQGTEGDVSE